MPIGEKLSRRAFAGLAAAAVALPAAALAAPARGARPGRRALIKPPRLRHGDLVGLVAPGGHTSDAGIEKAVRNIEALGFRVRPGANLRAMNGNYAGSVQQRVDDLHAMFADPGVRAIWCIRGGSGCISLLGALDYKLIRANPTILLGYSDITALHLAIQRHAGIVTFHGPHAGSTRSVYSSMHMLAVLGDPRAGHTIAMSPENSLRALTEPHYALRTVREGMANGPLMGGNVSMVSALAGTPYAIDYRGALLFLEEVNEPPYKMDRHLTQLDMAQGFSKAAAVIFGICENCGPADAEPSLTLDQTLDIHLAPLAIPAVAGYSFGHIRNQFTLPLGVRASLDTRRQTLTLLEGAVSA
ncbi:S66 peptidase family protein [Massilia glaciei]|uniref:LD-carboxypeptidase n=1 Tax=Massilia glaciei TaxID=1524097 RepID=A0A2U2H903_9BURK|nr:LD-carboxypeptidase [Massilia glaciei]PWF39101.1 LD-carboxypeptidase [Massilia glaciei]